MPEPTEEESIKAALLETVESFEELQVLAWFHARGDASVGTAELIAEQTVAPRDAAADALVSLAARGILSTTAARPDQFLYAPPAEMRDAVGRIVHEYQTNPVRVMALMTANAIERVRTAALRTFAESFRFRGPK